eukprot:13181817-Ditylum_brightwellii.AAC.1
MPLLWLYNNKTLYKDLLQDKLVDEPHAVALDDASTKRRPKNRHIYKTWMKNMVQGEEDCPIVFKKMMFDICSYDLTMCKN